jgi:DNA-binding Lrp family transcriptional regulator
MDALDRRIVAALSTTTRPNVLELSRRLGVARNTVQARLDHLDHDGVVRGYEPVLDLASLGYQVLAFSTLEIVQGTETGVVAGLAAIPEVIETHKMTGPGDLLVRIVARTNDHLNHVLEQLRTLYFNATQSTIGDDFGKAIELFKQLTNDEEREKAAVFMEGIAEMRREWGADTRDPGKGARPRKPRTTGRKP